MADVTETLVCSQCGEPAPAGQRFCGSCGAKLTTASGATAVQESVKADDGEIPSVAGSEPVTIRPAVISQSETVPARAPSRFTATAGVRPPVPVNESDRERDRLLTLANVQRMRGQLPEARQTVASALALAEGMSDKDLAPIHELYGDLLQSEDKWEEAMASFEKAHSLDPMRVGAEKKFAEATLRIAEAKAIASGSMLGLGDDSLGGSFSVRHRGKRNPGLALVMSLFVPGFGQLFNGELAKAGICLGVFLLTLAALVLSPDSAVLFAKIRIVMVPTDARAGSLAHDPLSPLMICLLILLGLNWAYSLFDAAAGASKSEESTSAVAPPAGDRSGWEV